MPEDTAVTYMPTISMCIAGEHTSAPQEWQECDSPALAKLAQAYDRMQKLQEKLSPLDVISYRLNLNGAMHGEKICTSVPDVQTVTHLGRYEANNKYDTLRFDLRKTSRSYEMPTDLAKDAPCTRASADALRALWRREQRAVAALQHIPYHYRKDATDSLKFCTTEAPENDDIQRISNPDKGGAVLNEFGRFVEQFYETLKRPPTHAACSLKTAVRIARNADTGAPLFEEARRTGGGVCPFPGLAGLYMVISAACPDNVLYVTSEMLPVLLRAEGPKIIKRGESGALAVTDFFQYKCAYEELQTDSPFACIIDLQTA